MVKTWARHKTTEALLNNVWQRLVVAVGGGGCRLPVGGGWQWLAVGGSWQLVAVGGWRWAVGGGWRWLLVVSS